MTFEPSPSDGIAPFEPDVEAAVRDVTRDLHKIREKQADRWAAFALTVYENGRCSVAVIKPTDLVIFEIAVEISSNGAWTPADFTGSEDALALISGTDDVLRVTYRSPYGVKVEQLEIVPL